MQEDVGPIADFLTELKYVTFCSIEVNLCLIFIKIKK